MQKVMKHAVETADVDRDSYIRVSMISSNDLTAAIQKQVTVDMDEQACSEALAGLNAYYKVKPFFCTSTSAQMLTLTASGCTQELCRQRL